MQAVLFAKATVIENTLFGYLKVKTQVSAQCTGQHEKIESAPPAARARGEALAYLSRVTVITY